MQRPIAIAVLAVLTWLLPLGDGRAARDVTALFGSGPRYEILVFERPTCSYCEVFRADVASRYREQPQASKMPLRFVDIDRVDTSVLGLKRTLSILPTAVVMRDGVEVDRVQGLVTARNFILLVQHIAGALD